MYIFCGRENDCVWEYEGFPEEVIYELGFKGCIGVYQVDWMAEGEGVPDGRYQHMQCLDYK